jgi:hypothetical protein
MAGQLPRFRYLGQVAHLAEFRLQPGAAPQVVFERRGGFQNVFHIGRSFTAVFYCVYHSTFSLVLSMGFGLTGSPGYGIIFTEENSEATIV